MEKKDKGLWSEIPIPPAATDCQRCELAGQRERIIWGEGNPKGQILALLDNPGARENKLGEPFLCGTRETLYSTVDQVGLKEEDILLTFVLRCRPRRKYDKEKARNTCMVFFQRQLMEAKPHILICLGNTAAQWYLGDQDATIKELRGRITLFKDIPTVFTYHPLAVRRRPAFAKLFLSDWQLVADYYLY